MPCTHMKAHVLKLCRILRPVAGTHLLNRERMRCQRFGAAARREEEEYPSWIFDRRATSRQRQRSATLRATPWRAPKAFGVAPQSSRSRGTAAMLLRRALPATRQGVAHPFPIYEMGSWESTYRPDPLLINSLAAFNFRPPIRLEFPGERLARTPRFAQ
jgi:hypothetical protein